MEHTKSSMHTHMMGVFNGKAKDGVYDFGWGNVWRWGFLVGGLVFFAIAVGTLLINVISISLFIISAIAFLVAVQLLLGDLAQRFIFMMDSELVLPYVDLLAPDAGLVLDAGCGSGRTSIAIGKSMKKGRIVAIDRFDADYIEGGGKQLLERNLKIAGLQGRVDIRSQDITGLDFGDGTFDAAVSSYMFDHLGDKKLKGLKEVNRVLKKDGKFLLIVAVPNFYTFMAFSLISRLALIPINEWKRLFDQSSFKCVAEGNVNGGHYFLLEKV